MRAGDGGAMIEVTITRREITALLEQHSDVARFTAAVKAHTNARLLRGGLVPGGVLYRDVDLGGVNWVRVYSTAL